MVDYNPEMEYGKESVNETDLGAFMEKVTDEDTVIQNSTNHGRSNYKNPEKNYDLRLTTLGIPAEEYTPAVSLAISALFEKIEDMGRELSRTRNHLNELEQLVDVDCLAPIPNRRAFMRRLNWAISIHERYSYPICVLYFDMNNLKEINDILGHAAGDTAIRHIANILSSTTRESDFIARIGGDEFALILFHSDYENACKRAKAIVDKIETSPLRWNGKDIKTSTACGVYSIKKGDTSESALSAADTAMYIDKKRIKTRQEQVIA